MLCGLRNEVQVSLKDHTHITWQGSVQQLQLEVLSEGVFFSHIAADNIITVLEYSQADIGMFKLAHTHSIRVKTCIPWIVLVHVPFGPLV